MTESPLTPAPTATSATLDLLRAYESPNVTFIAPDKSWPIVWERARGVHVWDVEGRQYLDLTAAFGVAAAGHANPRVVRAGQRQMATLLHAMGDVHPHRLKARLARELSRLLFERWHSELPQRFPPGAKAATGKTIFCSSGFEAVEAALKTALLATGKPGIVAFEGAYHGLGYGALNATHRDRFRGPFRSQLREFGHFLPFPRCSSCSCPGRITGRCGALDSLEAALVERCEKSAIGAVLVEPVQVRGGIHIPDPGFLNLLRRVCERFGALLVFDEIYTGFGRTGRWFASEHSAVVPDLVCLGKALTGGFPLSACVGRADIMDAAWPPSDGEAIHTSTFLGHPVGCAMALAQIEEIEQRNLGKRSARLGCQLLRLLGQVPAPSGFRLNVRGLGLLAGLELSNEDGSPATGLALKVITRLLHEGFILLPEGAHSNVISFSPPLTIPLSSLKHAAVALAVALADSASA
jgi:4-aminobutyrate aminotransferase-like enzyme